MPNILLSLKNDFYSEIFTKISKVIRDKIISSEQKNEQLIKYIKYLLQENANSVYQNYKIDLEKCFVSYFYFINEENKITRKEVVKSRRKNQSRLIIRDELIIKDVSTVFHLPVTRSTILNEMKFSYDLINNTCTKIENEFTLNPIILSLLCIDIIKKVSMHFYTENDIKLRPNYSEPITFLCVEVFFKSPEIEKNEDTIQGVRLIKIIIRNIIETLWFKGSKYSITDYFPNQIINLHEVEN